MDVIDLFERGGPLMWPILGCSVIALVIFVERLIALRNERILPRQVYQGLQRHLGVADAARAEQLCRESDSVLCRVVGAGLAQRGGGRAVAKEAMEETGQVEVGSLEAGVGALSTVAAIAPLLGLLGTVTGMIQVFRDIAGEERAEISVFADGIWQALITTGAGLTVAIPAYIAYRYVEVRIERLGRRLEEASLDILNRMVPATGAEHEEAAPALASKPTAGAAATATATAGGGSEG